MEKKQRDVEKWYKTYFLPWGDKMSYERETSLDVLLKRLLKRINSEELEDEISCTIVLASLLDYRVEVVDIPLSRMELRLYGSYTYYPNHLLVFDFDRKDYLKEVSYTYNKHIKRQTLGAPFAIYELVDSELVKSNRFIYDFIKPLKRFRERLAED